MTPILTDGSNPFAYHTVTVRLPRMIDTVVNELPELSASQVASLRVLQDELAADARISMPDTSAPGHHTWDDILAAQDERLGHPATWRNAEWFVLEHAFFRRILCAVDYWNSGCDPFGPAKARELTSTELWRQLATMLEVDRDGKSTSETRFLARVRFSLWGNRLDLSHSESLSHATVATSGGQAEGSLIADDSHTLWSVCETLDRPVQVICDNAGTELLADLALADWLIRERGVSVGLHLKSYPTFVSDATPADVDSLLTHLSAPDRPDELRQLAHRLVSWIEDGSIGIVPDPFWNTPGYFTSLPGHLYTILAASGLVVVKGDMNYRRMLGDRIVPATDPLGRWAAPMPAPTAMLRTMKGDPVAGISSGTLTTLNAEHPGWRTAGKHGVIQLMGASPQKNPGDAEHHRGSYS